MGDRQRGGQAAWHSAAAPGTAAEEEALPAEVMLRRSPAATAARSRHPPALPTGTGDELCSTVGLHRCRQALSRALRLGQVPRGGGTLLARSPGAGRGCRRGWVKPVEGDWAGSPCDNEFLTQFKPDGWEWA